MSRYKKILEELISKKIKPTEGEFYDFEEFPLGDQFDEFFNYCQDFLERTDLPFDISPARFYYNTNTLENALAKVINDYYIVEVNKGAVFSLHTFFTQKAELFKNKELETYNSLVAVLEITADYLLFQLITLFFLYHEVGHLIQRKLGSADYSEFMVHKCEGQEVEERHIREHDADWFAVTQVAAHIIEAAQRISNKINGNLKQILTEIGSLALAGIYMNFTRWSTNSEIYYQDNCHPHPSIRICYIINYLLENIQANSNEALDQSALLRNSLVISEILMKDGETNPIEKYSLQILSEIENISKYINKIRTDSENYPYLSRIALNA